MNGYPSEQDYQTPQRNDNSNYEYNIEKDGQGGYIYTPVVGTSKSPLSKTHDDTTNNESQDQMYDSNTSYEYSNAPSSHYDRSEGYESSYYDETQNSNDYERSYHDPPNTSSSSHHVEDQSHLSYSLASNTEGGWSHSVEPPYADAHYQSAETTIAHSHHPHGTNYARDYVSQSAYNSNDPVPSTTVPASNHYSGELSPEKVYANTHGNQYSQEAYNYPEYSNDAGVTSDVHQSTSYDYPPTSQNNTFAHNAPEYSNYHESPQRVLAETYSTPNPNQNPTTQPYTNQGLNYDNYESAVVPYNPSEYEQHPLPSPPHPSPPPPVTNPIRRQSRPQQRTPARRQPYISNTQTPRYHDFATTPPINEDASASHSYSNIQPHTQPLPSPSHYPHHHHNHPQTQQHPQHPPQGYYSEQPPPQMYNPQITYNEEEDSVLRQHNQIIVPNEPPIGVSFDESSLGFSHQTRDMILSGARKNRQNEKVLESLATDEEDDDDEDDYDDDVNHDGDESLNTSKSDNATIIQKQRKKRNRFLILSFFLVLVLIAAPLILAYFYWYRPFQEKVKSEDENTSNPIQNGLDPELDIQIDLNRDFDQTSTNADKSFDFEVINEDDLFDDDAPLRLQLPSFSPSLYPSRTPSKQPSSAPTLLSSTVPSKSPSLSPSNHPSGKPSINPTSKPSAVPSTHFPSRKPSQSPSSSPSRFSSSNPSKSMTPSNFPTSRPSPEPQWVKISPDFHTDTDSTTYGFSTSLSADGTRLAVLHEDAVSVYQYENFRWSKLGSDVFAVWLLFDTGKTWNSVFSDNEIVSTSITLSSDGMEFAWDLALKDIGRVALFTLFDGNWIRRGKVGGYEQSPGGSSYGSSLGYAKHAKNRLITGGWNGEGARVYEYDDANVAWNLLGNEIEGFNPGLVQSLLVDREGPMFGASVAMSSDGLTVAVAAPKDGSKERGSVKVYQLNIIRQTWEEKGKELRGPLNSNFGIVTLSGDGNRLAVGIPQISAVQIFEYSPSLFDWNLIGSKNGNISAEKFGQMVTLSEDGNSLLVIAPITGRICVYKFNEFVQTWIQRSFCFDNGTVGDEYLRYSASLSEDGSRLVIGTPKQGTAVYELRS